MKNTKLIYAATDAASFYAKTSSDISLLLSRYLDEDPIGEEELIEKIRGKDFLLQRMDAGSL